MIITHPFPSQDPAPLALCALFAVAHKGEILGPAARHSFDAMRAPATPAADDGLVGRAPLVGRLTLRRQSFR